MTKFCIFHSEIRHYDLWLIEGRNHYVLLLLYQFLKFANINHYIFNLLFEFINSRVFLLTLYRIFLLELLHTFFMFFNNFSILPLKKFQSFYFFNLMTIFYFSIQLIQFVFQALEMPFLFLLYSAEVAFQTLDLRIQCFISQAKILEICNLFVYLGFFKIFKGLLNFFLLFKFNRELYRRWLRQFFICLFKDNWMMKKINGFLFIHNQCKCLQNKIIKYIKIILNQILQVIIYCKTLFQISYLFKQMKDNDNYADSLEENAFSNLMLNKSKSKDKQKNNLQEMEISIFGLKAKFNSALEKLAQSDTREMAMKELTKLIDDFRNQETLRIYLSILKGVKRNAVNNGTKEHQILVIAYICEKYKENLIDPIDKPPSLMKTAFRVVELIHKYFPENSMTVQQACARALIDLYSYCIKKESVQNRISLIFLPLASIMTTGMDRMSQSTASVCITELVQYWYNNKQYEILKRIQSQLLFVFFKINPEYYQLLSAITICLQLSGMDFFQNKFTQFITKIQSFLNDSSYQSIRSTSNQFNSYMAKVQACKMFEKIALMIADHPNYLEQIKPMEIMAELEKSSKNRVIQVQRASQKALKSWRVLLKLEQQENKDQGNNERIAPYKLISLDQMRKKFKRERSFSKEESEEKTRKFEKIEEELKFMKQDLSELVKGKGWGPQNRGHHFIKKGTGIGGGHVGKLDISPGSKSRKTYETHLKELKKFVQNERNNKRNNTSNVGHKVQNDNNNINQSDVDYENIRINDQRIVVKPSILKQYRDNKDDKLKQNEIESNNKNQEIDKKDEQFLQIDDEKGQQQILPFALNNKKKNEKQTQNNKQHQIQNQLNQLHNNNEFSTSQKKESRILQFLKKPEIEVKSKQQFLSNQEIEDIMKNTSLDNISSYLGDILNEDDLLNHSKLQLMDSKIIQNGQDHIKIRELKQVQQQNKNSNVKSEMAQKQHIKLDTDSLSLSNSKNKIYKQQMEESLKLQLSKYQEQRRLNSSRDKKEEIREREPRNNNMFQIGANLLQVPLVNSNNNNSKESERFTNLKPPKANDEEEVEEEVVSVYQQSKEPIYNQASNREKKSSGLTKKEIKQIEFYELNKSNNFQNLIKNPPKQQKIITSQRNQIKESVKQQQSKNITQPQQDELLTDWRQILELIQYQDFDGAFERVFQMDDSIYLVRLLLLTGGNLDKLTPNTIKQLWNRFGEVYKSRFFEVLMLANFQQALGLGILNKTLSLNQNNYLMTTLFQMSGFHKGKLSYKSAVLYNEIEKKLKE